MKRFALFLMTLVAISSQVHGYDFVIDGIAYKINEDGKTVNVCKGNSSAQELLTEIIVPDTVIYYGVKFAVKEIECSAFSLAVNVVCAKINAETINPCFNSTFEYALSKVVLGDKVKILNEAFHSCSNLRDVEFGENVQTIGNHSFAECVSLTEVTLPPHLDSIGARAFYKTGIRSLQIPASVTRISNRFIGSCDSLSIISVDSSNPFYDSRDGCNAIIATETNTLLAGCKTSVIPESVVSIGDYAFSSTNIIEIASMPSVVTIGEHAFFQSSIQRINLPEGLQSILTGAFEESQLQSVVIPKSVTDISPDAFRLCEQLRYIGFANNSPITTLAERFAQGANHVKWFDLPSNLKRICDCAMPTTKYSSAACILDALVLPNTIEHLPQTVQLARNLYIDANSNFSVVDHIPSNKSVIPIEHLTIGRDLSSFKEDDSVNGVNWPAKNVSFLPQVQNIEDAAIRLYATGDEPGHIYCYGDTPPVCNNSTFLMLPSYNQVILHVPAHSIEKYKAAPVWSDFSLVVDDAVMAHSLTLDKSSIHLNINETASIQTELIPANANGAKMVIVCANPLVADLTSDGRIKAKTNGHTTLHCLYGHLRATCEIVVGDDTSTITKDVNGDGTVDISDVNAVINVMLGRASQTAASDVNGDGKVDISDVNAIINAMLGKE